MSIKMDRPFTGWDERSAIRERLFLLADRWPDYTFEAADWTYNPQRDEWTDGGGYARRVGYEASAALEELDKHGVSRREAMMLIGYPEAD